MRAIVKATSSGIFERAVHNDAKRISSGCAIARKERQSRESPSFL
jgi:hypothetical protein